MPLDPVRRLLLVSLALPLVPGPVRAAGAFVRVVASSGGASAVLPSGDVVPLTEGLDLPEGTRIDTQADGLAELELPDGTRVFTGRQTTILLQPSQVQSHAALTMAGVVVVDRRTAPSDAPIKVSGQGFDVELAGAQVFIESLRADAGGSVFVKDGGASVRSPQGEIILASGEGVDLPGRPAPDEGGIKAQPAPHPEREPDGFAPPVAGNTPTPPAAAPGLPQRPPVSRWSQDRVEDAFASVGLTT